MILDRHPLLPNPTCTTINRRGHRFSGPNVVAGLPAERLPRLLAEAERTVGPPARTRGLPAVVQTLETHPRQTQPFDDAMLRAVLDTNVAVGACFAPASASARILQSWRTGRFGLVMSDALRGELAHLARRLRNIRGVRRPAECLAALLDELDARAEWVDPAPLEITLSDKADELVLGTAVAGQAAFLVSNDAVLLAVDGYRGIRIIRPGRFLDLLKQQPSEHAPDTPAAT